MFFFVLGHRWIPAPSFVNSQTQQTKQENSPTTNRVIGAFQVLGGLVEAVVGGVGNAHFITCLFLKS